MKTNATEENILKYYDSLILLHKTLNLTNRVSMLKFSEQNHLSKSLSTVLREGKIIKCTKRGKDSQWVWTSIKPTREMAIKTLQELGKINPPRETQNETQRDRKKTTGGRREVYGRKSESFENRCLESYTVKLLFGMIKINIILNYK